LTSRWLDGVLLGLRVLLEASVVAGLAYWGVATGGSTAAKISLGIAAPAAGFTLWGAVDFAEARHGELLRRSQELVISGIAAAAVAVAGSPRLGGALAGLAIAYHALLYGTGRKLLRPRAD
jgi:hypothetical protein